MESDKLKELLIIWARLYDHARLADLLEEKVTLEEFLQYSIEFDLVAKGKDIKHAEILKTEINDPNSVNLREANENLLKMVLKRIKLNEKQIVFAKEKIVELGKEYERFYHSN